MLNVCFASLATFFVCVFECKFALQIRISLFFLSHLSVIGENIKQN